MKLKAAAFEEASDYQGLLLVLGIVGVGSRGVFTWTHMDYNLVTTGWLLAQEVPSDNVPIVFSGIATLLSVMACPAVFKPV